MPANNFIFCMDSLPINRQHNISNMRQMSTRQFSMDNIGVPVIAFTYTLIPVFVWNFALPQATRLLQRILPYSCCKHFRNIVVSQYHRSICKPQAVSPDAIAPVLSLILTISLQSFAMSLHPEPSVQIWTLVAKHDCFIMFPSHLPTQWP